MGRDRVGTVGTMVGEKGNGLSNEFLDPANTVRVLEPHAAARTPLKNPENSITDPSESSTRDEEKEESGGALEALRRNWIVSLWGERLGRTTFF